MEQPQTRVPQEIPKASPHDKRHKAGMWQALAASGAYFTMLTGLAHEVIGPTLFPWAPAFFGTVIWHALGAVFFVLGALMFAGTLRLVHFPVANCAKLVAVGAAAALVFMAMRQEFHFLALCVLLSATMTAFSEKKLAAG